jgi:hypothetical protein
MRAKVKTYFCAARLPENRWPQLANEHAIFSGNGYEKDHGTRTTGIDETQQALGFAWGSKAPFTSAAR